MNILTSDKQGVFLRASISDICNFSCQYCASDHGMENHTPTCLHTPLLTAEQYIRNMQRLALRGFKIVSFTGGEPLLNADFPKIAKGCRELFDTVEITTNASAISKNTDTIRNYIDVLKISADAFDKELAAEIAGNGLAANTLEAVEECCRAGIKTIGLNFVYMRKNAAELPKLVGFAASLKKKYRTDVYISVLDLYYSPGNRRFWTEQFTDLSEVRKELESEGISFKRRARIGCDSYYCVWNDVTVNMKDSVSRTHRASICDKCAEYCQEGIYSLKHSASGWISVCPSNSPELGSLLGSDLNEDEANKVIDPYIKILNSLEKIDNTGRVFTERNSLSNRGSAL